MGIALCGRSKHLILDEPSSGIDVRARRELWSILQKYRKERTMLISTHYMDEAEALADRIVIIGKKPVKKNKENLIVLPFEYNFDRKRAN